MTCYHQIKNLEKPQRVNNGIIAKTLTVLHRHLCWIWYSVEHSTNTILAYVFEKHLVGKRNTQQI